MFKCNEAAVDTMIVDGRVVDEEQVRPDMDVLFHDLVASMAKVMVEREI